MKTYRTYLIAAAVLTAAACNKDYNVKEPTLEVSAPAIVKVGEKVEFRFEGQADMITFYSGELGHDYAYKDVDRIGLGNMVFSFLTTTSSGTPGYPNPAVLPMSYSTDFSGEYTREAMEAATWTDISSNFAWPTDTPESVPSGDFDFTHLFVDAETPIYFRFFYSVEAFDQNKGGGAGNGRTQWTIMNSEIKCDDGKSASVVYDIYQQGWQIIPGENYDKIQSSALPILPGTSAYLRFRSQFKPDVNLSYWAISAPIGIVREVNLGRDSGEAIKALADNRMSSYTYVYTEPGEYEVTFVGTNANMNGIKRSVSKVKVKVVQDYGNISGPEPGEWMKNMEE